MAKRTLFIIILLCCAIPMAMGWGVWGHNHINKGAVMALPKEMGMFFYNHADFITEESTVPDLRKHMNHDKTEAARHFINLEEYGFPGRTDAPLTLATLIAKYGKDTAEKYGTLPWAIQDMMVKLTDAMRNKRKTEILYLAADLGHYIGDAFMPLHTTVNHDGQMTGQQGIHAFWEAQLPELFGKDYKLYTANVHYIDDVANTTWDIIDSSYQLSMPLLRIEAKMKKDNPMDKQYVLGPDGEPKKNKFGSVIHTYEYAHIYHELLNGMVEKQMRAAIRMTASYWYTAWVNAGKPDLSSLDPDSITERNKAAYKDDLKAFKNGKVKGCGSDKEF
jgi:hypothetical protein